MSDEIKCPVCGKVGIPNYHEKNTICPCCGSDLGIFRVIDNIPQTRKNTRTVWMPIATVAILATVVLAGILCFQTPTTPTVPPTQLALLEDSIKTLNVKINNLDDQIDNLAKAGNSQSEGFKYVIKKGDSFWSISKRVYGTGTRYEEIAAANGMDSHSHLIVGDTIIIK